MRDAAVADDLRAILSQAGNRITIVNDEASALRVIEQNVPNALVIGADFGDDFIYNLHRSNQRLPIICWLSEYNSRIAVELMKKGAFDCLTPPMRVQEVIAVVSHALDTGRVSMLRLLPIYWAFGKTRKYLLVAIACLLLFIGVRAVNQYRRPLEMRLPYQDPTSVVCDGQNIWVGNWYTQSIYKYRIAGGEFVLLNTYYFSDFGPLALAWDGTYLWSVGNDLVVRQHLLNDKLEAYRSFHLSGENEPVGLAVTNQYVYICDASQKRIFRHLNDDTFNLSTSYSFQLPNPVGLVWSDAGVYIADAETNRIFRFENKGAYLAVVSRAKLPPDEFNSLAAFDIHRGSLYVTHSGKYARMLRYRPGVISWDAQKQEGGN
jgi:CheY-like chemotaxis protein